MATPLSTSNTKFQCVEDALSPGTVVVAMHLEGDENGTTIILLWDGGKVFTMWSVDADNGTWYKTDSRTVQVDDLTGAMKVGPSLLAEMGGRP